MKQFNYDYPNHYSIEGIEERVLDSLCEMLSTNVKEITVTTKLDDAYKNFTVECDNGISLDCEISFRDATSHWEVTVWQMS